MPPSGQGVVIDKKLFSRAIKDRKSKAADKAVLETIDKQFDVEAADLKKVLVEKLMKLVGGKVCQGVNNYYKEEQVKKGVKFTQKILTSLDYLTINSDGWVRDEDNNVVSPSSHPQLPLEVQRCLGSVQAQKIPSNSW